MPKKSKKTKTKSPFDVGLDMEQNLADSLYDKFLTDGEDNDAIDDAFIGAFHGFSYRMLSIFKKESILDIVNEIAQIVAEEQNEPHVCSDCAEKHGPAPVISIEDKNKLH